MPDSPQRIYWDACVFLSFIEGHPDRSKAIRTWLEKAEKGKVVIVTSTLSIVEVAFGKQEKDRGALIPEEEAKINHLWTPESPVALAEFHTSIALEARRLMRDAMASEIGLKPADAIHLATCRNLGIDEFHTYDGKLGGAAGISQLTITEPSLEQGELF